MRIYNEQRYKLHNAPTARPNDEQISREVGRALKPSVGNLHKLQGHPRMNWSQRCLQLPLAPFALQVSPIKLLFAVRLRLLSVD